MSAAQSPGTTLLTNLSLLDPRWDEARDDYHVLVEGDRIREVSEKPIRHAADRVIDCGRRVVMPGLIDCHVHIFLTEWDLRALESMPLTQLGARAARELRASLDRGFTTVRDAGGADWGMKAALDEGTVTGPRLFIAGRSIGPTGGHNDFRRRTAHDVDPCRCCNALTYSLQVADGADQVRQATREQLRLGADAIKLMMSGGVASPYDPLESRQLTDDEVSAAVEEASAFGRYVKAHAYTPEAIQRAVRLGVRTIEHGNLLDEETARLMSEHDAFLVANVISYQLLHDRADELEVAPHVMEKNDLVIDGGLRSLEICRDNGVPVGYGTDLLGHLMTEQSQEFIVRSAVLSNLEIIRQATLVGADIVGLPGELGVVEPGAFADLLVLDRNPLDTLDVFLGQGREMPVIMKAGSLHKCLL
jgi:imidazolonepropionase-like amidohydrolase